MAALAAPATGTPRTGSASGHLGGTPTHCFCVGFEDYSACFFSQTGGVGRVVIADGAATTTKMGGGVDDGGLAELLARKISEVARRRVVMTLAVRNLRSLDDVRSLVELFERAR